MKSCSMTKNQHKALVRPRKQFCPALIPLWFLPFQHPKHFQGAQGSCSRAKHSSNFISTGVNNHWSEQQDSNEQILKSLDLAGGKAKGHITFTNVLTEFSPLFKSHPAPPVPCRSCSYLHIRKRHGVPTAEGQGTALAWLYVLKKTIQPQTHWGIFEALFMRSETQ